jgi:hypothetical protein
VDRVTVIRDHGRFLDTDEHGWFLSPARHAEVQEAWRPALAELTAGCRDEIGAGFHSFYVRGSVACGTAVTGSSDLDAVIVVDDDEGERRPAWQHPLAARVLAGSPFITDVEVVVLGRGALAAALDPRAAAPVMAQWCFLLAVWGRCLEGTDLVPALGRFRPGHEVAYVVRSLPSDLRQFEARLAKVRAAGPSPAALAELQRLCVWTCKKLLRSGAELAMLDDGRFTRDLAPCSRRFAQRLPEHAATARALLEWAIVPPTDLAPLEQIVQRLEPTLARAAEEAGLVLDRVSP